jgi:hypothetical protein
MQKDEWYVIGDLNKFIESTRVLVFDIFGNTNQQDIDELSLLLSDLSEEEKQEIDTVLSQQECEVLAKDFITTEVNKKTKKYRYTLSNKKYMEMIECFNSRMISNMLNTLVNKGLLETAYDNESNDFIFWVKNNETSQEKPKTD